MSSFQVERDGEAIEREEFAAKKIGHDLARTNYEVDRARRSATGAERDVPATQTVFSRKSAQARVTSALLGIREERCQDPESNGRPAITMPRWATTPSMNSTGRSRQSRLIASTGTCSSPRKQEPNGSNSTGG